MLAFGFAVSNVLLEAGTNVSFDWLLGSPNELLLVAAKLVDVTVNVFEAELDP